MAKTEHSKLPLRKYCSFGGFRIVDADGCPVCDNVDHYAMDNKETPTQGQKADAEFIVRACNSFYPMLEALKMALSGFEELKNAFMEEGVYQEIVILREAIKNAEGE
jgi:hypothetical protein